MLETCLQHWVCFYKVRLDGRSDMPRATLSSKQFVSAVQRKLRDTGCVVSKLGCMTFYWPPYTHQTWLGALVKGCRGTRRSSEGASGSLAGVLSHCVQHHLWYCTVRARQYGPTTYSDVQTPDRIVHGSKVTKLVAVRLQQRLSSYQQCLSSCSQQLKGHEEGQARPEAEGDTDSFAARVSTATQL